MALTAPSSTLTAQTVSASFDQLLYVASASGLVEATLKVVSTEVGKSAVQLDDERLLVKGVDTSNAAAFDVQNTGGTSIFKVNASTVGTTTIGTVTVGVNDTGHDVKFFGATSGAYMLWDESQDDLIIGGAGRVGIGVTDPDSALEILSTSTQLKLSYDATNYATFDIAADGMLTITTVDPDGAEADIILAPDGNVGIGTSSPATLLDIEKAATTGTAPLPMITLSVADGGVDLAAGEGPAIDFYVAEEGATGGISNTLSARIASVREETVDTGTDCALTFWNGSNNNAATERMRIDSAGKIGIGTASPVSGLHVQDSDVTIMCNVADDTTSTALAFKRSKHATDGSDDTVVDADTVLGTVQWDGADGDSFETGAKIEAIADETWSGSARGTSLNFYTVDNTTTALDARMRIDHNGNVGIGTDSPSSALHVVSIDGKNLDYAAYIQNDGNSAARYGVKVVAGADDASGTTLYMDCADGDGGQVGYIANTSGTFDLTDPSDSRLKKNIVDTSVKGLETITKMKVRDFEWIKSGDKAIGGFIAQELKEAYPSAVNGIDGEMESYDAEYDDDGNITKEAGERIKPMGIMRSQLVPVLVKAIQELSAEVEKLKGN